MTPTVGPSSDPLAALSPVSMPRVDELNEAPGRRNGFSLAHRSVQSRHSSCTRLAAFGDYHSPAHPASKGYSHRWSDCGSLQRGAEPA